MASDNFHRRLVDKRLLPYEEMRGQPLPHPDDAFAVRSARPSCERVKLGLTNVTKGIRRYVGSARLTVPRHIAQNFAPGEEFDVTYDAERETISYHRVRPEEDANGTS